MNRTKSIAIALLLSFCSATVAAQEDHPEYNAVMAVVNQFFEAINTGNAQLMSAIMLDGSVNYRVSEQGDGTFSTNQRQESNTDRTEIPAGFTERYWDETVLIDNQIAVFWAPYDFYIKGEFSHCGVDSLDLVKVDDEWKMTNTMYTIVRTGCPPSPLGEL